MIPLVMVTALVNGLVSVPPSHWKAINLGVQPSGSQVHIDFEVRTGSRVQALVLTEAGAERFHRGRSSEPVCSSGFHTAFRLRCRVPERDHYVLMVDNRIESRQPATVHLRVQLQSPPNAVARELPPDRRRAVVALSLAFFGAVVLFSARQFLQHR